MTSPLPYHAVFPGIATNIPANAAALSDIEFGAELKKAAPYPHWLFHLWVQKPCGFDRERELNPHRRDWVEDLASALGLGHRSWRVGLLEQLNTRKQPQHGPAADVYFPLRPLYPPDRAALSPYFRGGSLGLAVAAGLLAVATEQAIPAGVVFSGCLRDPLSPALPFDKTGEIEKKFQLCWGRQDAFDVVPLVERVMAYGDWLGPYEFPTLSGDVKLLVLPTETDVPIEQLVEDLELEFNELGCDAFDSGEEDGVGPRIRELAGSDGMAVAFVPSAWHAFRLVGLHRRCPRVVEMLNRHPEDGAVQLFVRRPKGKPQGSTAEAAFVERRAKLALSEVNRQLQGLAGPHQRMQTILDGACTRLRCAAGNLAHVTTEDDNILRNIIWSGRVNELPPVVPRHEGISGEALHKRKTIVANNRQEFLDHCRWRSPRHAGAAPWYAGDPRWRAARERVLDGIGACVVVPLHFNSTELGVMCLQWPSKIHFSSVAKRVAEELGGCLTREVHAVVEAEKEARRWDGAREMGRVAGLVVALGRDLARQRVGSELARLSADLSGARRAAVRVRGSHCEDLEFLAAAGVQGADSAGDFAERVLAGTSHPVLLDIPAARPPDVHPNAAAHMVVLLRAGGRLIGTLSLDFSAEQRLHCNEGLRTRLENFVSPFAAYLDALLTDQFLEQLERDLPPLRGAPATAGESSAWLALVKCQFGADEVACFERAPDGLYREVAALGRLPAQRSPGERWPEQVAPQEHKGPRWSLFGDEERLFVTVVGRGDMLGLLEFVWRVRGGVEANVFLDPVFPSAAHPQQLLAERVANRIGASFEARAAACRGAALARLDEELWRARTRRDLCRAASTALTQGIGDCVCLIRTVDLAEAVDGTISEVLDLLFLDGDEQHHWPFFHKRGNPVAGWVWKNKEMWFSSDVHGEPRLSEINDPWKLRSGCCVVTPLLVDADIIGTLAIHRRHPHTLLQADIDFVKKVNRKVSQALGKLNDDEAMRIRNGFLRCALRRSARDADAAAPERLLSDIRRELERGLGVTGAAGFVWQLERPSNQFHPVGQPNTRSLSAARVTEDLPENGFCVVSEPSNEDTRLTVLTAALPEHIWRRFEGGQRAALLLTDNDSSSLWLPPAVFLLLVPAGQRLSFTRVQHMVMMLTTTCPRLARQGKELTTGVGWTGL